MTSSSAPSVRPFPVLADVVAGTRARDVLLIVGGALLTALCAQISIHVPPSPVPITGQTFAVVMAGACLGARRGGSSQLLYVVAGLVLPIYADGGSGWHTVWGPSGGYLVAFPMAAWGVGRLAEHGRDRYLISAVVAYVLGQLIIFGVGVPWLKVSADLPWSTAVHDGFTIFIVGGLIKAVAAGVLRRPPGAWCDATKADPPAGVSEPVRDEPAVALVARPHVDRGRLQRRECADRMPPASRQTRSGS